MSEPAALLSIMLEDINCAMVRSGHKQLNTIIYDDNSKIKYFGVWTATSQQ